MSGSSATTGSRSRAMGRVAVAILLVVSICATAVTRQWAIDSHAVAANPGRTVAETGESTQGSSLSAMPSYATALLLGGLRGPLVMILWTTSETQKQQHELQDFDTKVEWIRLLQPEFDTVHLFQIWNKAYNVSVLMADQANKYTTVLDAIDYGQKVDRERPDDINIISAIAGIYGDKLGTSQEHPYYRRQVRKETQTRYRVSFPDSRAGEFRAAAGKLEWIESDAPLVVNQKTHRDSVLLERPLVDALKPVFGGSDVTIDEEKRHVLQSNDPSWRRLRLDPMVDADGNVFPDLLTPRYLMPSDWPATSDWYDGSRLQFLKKYEPYPYGISPLALAYNEYKRAQLLQRNWNERHMQTSDMVVDSRPAIYLKLWGHDEWERGRRAELRMWGTNPPVNYDPDDLELPAAQVGYAEPVVNRLERDLALYSYKTAARLFQDSRAEYEHHIKGFPFNAATYYVHIDDTRLGEHMMLADYDYMALGTATGDARQALMRDAAKEYNLAAQWAAITALKFYFDDEIAHRVFPMKNAKEQFTRADIELSDPSLWVECMARAEQTEILTASDEDHHYHPGRDPYSEDREPYLNYVRRSLSRIVLLTGAPPPATLPQDTPLHR